MRFTNNAVAASVAGSCPLVAEVTSSNGRHRGTYIIEPAPIQFYDLQGSGKKPHFQVHENQVPVIEAILLSQGFVQADSNEEAAGYYAEGLPFFRHLSNDVDHFLPDLTVINNFDDNEYLLSLVALIDAKGMAQRLFVDDYESASGGGRDAANKRGNLLLSAGYCAMDQTDRSVVQGMNFPKRTKATSRMSGLNGDRTMEETMFKHACRVVEISDYITFNHPYEGSTMAERVFSDEERNKSFGTRWAVELGQARLMEFARFDATSVFGTGHTQDNHAKKTERHVDAQNASEHNEDRCPTLTVLVTVEYHGVEVLVRVGTNVYKKECCSKARGRTDVNEELADELLNHFEGPRESMDEDGDVSLHEKFFCPPEGFEEEEVWVYDADVDKDGMLSLYLCEMYDLCEHVGWDRALLIEALHTIPLTPAADGWLRNFREVGRDLVEGDGDEGDNVFFAYVSKALEEHGTVSNGVYRRCQTSHRGRITVRQAIQSWQNMDSCFRLADESDDTKKVIKMMSKSVKRGGIHGVGEFYAHVLLNLSIKLQLVRNHTHLENVAVAPSTNTFKRLKKVGFKSKNHVAEIVPFLVGRLQRTALTCENMVCEYLRFRFGKDGTKDVFVRGHVLFRADRDGVYTVDCDGSTHEVWVDIARFGNGYRPHLVWWAEDSIVFGSGGHPYDSDVIALKTV